MDPLTSPLPWGLEFKPLREGDARKRAGWAPVGLPGSIGLTQTFDHTRNALQLTLANNGDEPWHATTLILEAELDDTAVEGYAWIQGRYMQMDALVRAFGTDLPDGYDGRYYSRDGETNTYVSREMVALSLPARGNPALLVGSLRMDRFFLDIQLTLNEDETVLESLTLLFELNGLELAPGETLELPPVRIADGREPLALLDAYAAAVGKEMNARVPEQVPTGWCSWYYFYDRVTEADILANLAQLRASGYPADFVQIDDGYQAATGDWLTPNEKFPSGMAALAERIRDAGYRPGLWLAPLLLHEDSAALRDHPELVLRTQVGDTYFVDTWLGRCAVLDCTKPETEAWLREVITTVVKEWGYTYLKLDALAFAAVSATHGVEFAQPNTTGPANLRRGLEIMREAAGDDTFILGCTCHFGPAIGLVDAMRVGADVKELWEDGPRPSVRHAMRLSLMRNWMHGHWWANDPDCLIVREENSSLNEPEVRFLASSIALTGGMVVSGDHLSELSPDRQALAKALFPPTGVAAFPRDPAEAPVPSTWRADLGDARFLVGILNWGDANQWALRDELLRPGEVAFDVWNGRVIGMGDVLLRPHEGLIWQVTGRGATPRVVGDSGSLTYAGLYQRQVSGRVQVRNDGDAPRTVAIEARGQVFEVDLAPGEMRWFD